MFQVRRFPDILQHEVRKKVVHKSKMDIITEKKKIESGNLYQYSAATHDNTSSVLEIKQESYKNKVISSNSPPPPQSPKPQIYL